MQSSAWRDFLEQITNPKQRARLREPLAGKLTSHKFHHLTGTISDYSKKPSVKPHHTTHAKKQSMTLISWELNTKLFQSANLKTLLVGIVLRADPQLEQTSYDARRAKIKALLLSDTGTYHRQWRGSLDDVKQYAQSVKNYTYFNEFKQVICLHTATNEVLAEPSKDSLLGILLGRDTPQARKLARQYQVDIKTKLGLHLPIILYNSEQNKLIEDLDLYEGIQQRNDFLFEKEQLLNTTECITSSGFFNGYAHYQWRLYPKHVVRRLQAIDEALLKLAWIDRRDEPMDAMSKPM